MDDQVPQPVERQEIERVKAYAEMAADQQREREAEEWSEALIDDACGDAPGGKPHSILGG